MVNGRARGCSALSFMLFALGKPVDWLARGGRTKVACWQGAGSHAQAWGAHPSSVRAKHPMLLTSSICLRKSPWCLSVPSLRTEPPNRLNCRYGQVEEQAQPLAGMDASTKFIVSMGGGGVGLRKEHLHRHFGAKGAISTECSTFMSGEDAEWIIPKVKHGNESCPTQCL